MITFAIGVVWVLVCLLLFYLGLKKTLGILVNKNSDKKHEKNNLPKGLISMCLGLMLPLGFFSYIFLFPMEGPSIYNLWRAVGAHYRNGQPSKEIRRLTLEDKNLSSNRCSLLVETSTNEKLIVLVRFDPETKEIKDIEEIK